MGRKIHTPEFVAEAVPLISVLKSAQPSKQAIAAAIAEAFINGMNVQAQLNSPAPVERPSA